MSGIEIVGVVASIIQIAELGGRLSVKLCTFCHQFKNADKALRLLSKDVALTCSVLRQLGDSLGQDDLASLYSPDAFKTAQDVLKECEQVFHDLDSALEQHRSDAPSHTRLERMTRKIKFLMNEPHLETVAGNLERLKSTMLLMLNVVIYAGQIRSRRETHEIQAQRNILLVLTNEKIASEANYEKLTRALQFTTLTVENVSDGVANATQPETFRDELSHYCDMVKSVLYQIDRVQDMLSMDRYARVRNGFVDLHQKEAVTLQHVHGQKAVDLFQRSLQTCYKTEFHQANPTSSPTQAPRRSGNSCEQVFSSHLPPATADSASRSLQSSRLNARELPKWPLHERTEMADIAYAQQQAQQQAQQASKTTRFLKTRARPQTHMHPSYYDTTPQLLCRYPRKSTQDVTDHQHEHIAQNLFPTWHTQHGAMNRGSIPETTTLQPGFPDSNTLSARDIPGQRPLETAATENSTAEYNFDVVTDASADVLDGFDFDSFLHGEADNNSQFTFNGSGSSAILDSQEPLLGGSSSTGDPPISKNTPSAATSTDQRTPITKPVSTLSTGEQAPLDRGRKRPLHDGIGKSRRSQPRPRLESPQGRKTHVSKSRSRHTAGKSPLQDTSSYAWKSRNSGKDGLSSDGSRREGNPDEVALHSWILQWTKLEESELN